MITLTGAEDIAPGPVRASCLLCEWTLLAPTHLALLALDAHITAEHPS